MEQLSQCGQKLKRVRETLRLALEEMEEVAGQLRKWSIPFSLLGIRLQSYAKGVRSAELSHETVEDSAELLTALE